MFRPDPNPISTTAPARSAQTRERISQFSLELTEQLIVRAEHDERIARLTDREREVLDLMAQGRSNTAIAQQVRCSLKTLETHVRYIFQKLDLQEDASENRRVAAVVHWLNGRR